MKVTSFQGQKYKPILFSTPMVQAIMDGRKTMTRRVISEQDGIHPRWNNIDWLGWDDGHGNKMRQPHAIGDILWVRETWHHYEKAVGNGEKFHVGQFTAFKADENNPRVQKSAEWYEGQWRPSIFMPKEACRLFLRVTDVRAERLQEITEEDAKREGVCGLCYDAITGAEKYDMTFFKILWNDINSKRGYGWEVNPWVWVYTFERIAKPEGWPNV